MTAEKLTGKEIVVDFFRLPSVYLSIIYVALVLISSYLVKRFKQYDMDKPSLRLLHNTVCCIGNLVIGIEMAVCMAGNSSISSIVDHRDLFKRVFVWVVPLKLFEMLFTFIIIFQKQWSRLTFLEIYYRVTMLIIADAGYRYGSVPAMGFFFCVSCFTHVITHTYFLLSEAVEFPLWARRTLTIFQIVSFLVLLTHAIVGYYDFGHCIYYSIYCASLIVLYVRFFVKRLTGIPHHRQFNVGKYD
eukprot:m.2010 g.2010  ORF g.2010 m.2010 type:complete len:244 (-) comp1694_c0_seq1:174-905(-)